MRGQANLCVGSHIRSVLTRGGARCFELSRLGALKLEEEEEEEEGTSSLQNVGNYLPVGTV